MEIIMFLSKYFALLLIYSFCGWLIEVIGELFISRKFVNRGFLIGPICPVYGVGAVIITLLLTPYENDYLVLFGLSIIFCGTLEYFTSYLLEKLFNARWWDYSNQKFNIKGRICLSNLIWFGIAGIAIIKVFNPIIYSIIDLIPKNIICFIFWIFLVLLLIDIIVSLTIVNKIRNISDSIKNETKDSTAEISAKVRETILQQSSMYRRVLEAFPHVFADKVKHVASEIKETAIEKTEKTKRLTKYRIKRIKRTINRRKIVTIGKHEKEVENETNT